MNSNGGGSGSQVVHFMMGAKPRPRLEDMDSDQLRARVELLEAGYRNLSQTPKGIASVIEESADHFTLNLGQHVTQVGKPTHLHVEPGMVVQLSNELKIIAVVEKPPSYGVIANVQHIVDEAKHRAAIQVKGDPNERIVLYAGAPPRENDQVLLDLSMTVIVENLGQKRNELQLTRETGVCWDDIGGQEAAKRELKEAIEEPYTHAELYKAYGKKPVRGILLWGPPGCGKTMFFKAAATAVANLHGESARTGGVIAVKGPEILNHWVGASEAGIRSLFTAARSFYKANGYPPIIAIDEADAIFGKRGRNGIEGMERTIVPQFLAEMDGMDEMNAVVILATNRADSLDPAVVRDGRIDRKIEVGRPNREDSAAIVGRVLRGRKTAEGVDADSLGARAAALLFDDKRALYMVRVNAGIDRRIALSDFVSGAMCAGIAERAVQLAIRRHISGQAPEGIAEQDVEQAVADTRESVAGIDHETEIAAVLETFPAGSIKSVERTPKKPASTGN